MLFENVFQLPASKTAAATGCDLMLFENVFQLSREIAAERDVVI